VSGRSGDAAASSNKSHEHQRSDQPRKVCGHILPRFGILPEELEQIPPDYTSAIRYSSGLFDAEIMESPDGLRISVLVRYTLVRPSLE
jgi:hypothetical protein